MKKNILLFISLSVLVGCSKHEKATEDNAVTKVETTVVKTISANSKLRYSGTIEAFQSIPLTFQTAGTIETVLVDEGDVVSKGQLLATVDKTDAQSMYQLSNAKYQQAVDAYNRLKTVHDNGSLPEIKWVEMESNLQQAESSLEIAKNNLKKCSIYAPENGIIGKRNIEPGMSSLSNPTAAIELVKIEKIYVKIAVPENEIGLIKKGDKALFKVSAVGEETFEGIVENVGVVADKISRTYEIKVLASNSKKKLKPGMVCDLSMDIDTEKEVLAIPYQCVSTDMNKKPYVFVVNKNTNNVEKRTISVGKYLNNNIEVINGLSEGETVVLEGKEKLDNKSSITL